MGKMPTKNEKKSQQQTNFFGATEKMRELASLMDPKANIYAVESQTSKAKPASDTPQKAKQQADPPETKQEVKERAKDMPSQEKHNKPTGNSKSTRRSGKWSASEHIELLQNILIYGVGCWKLLSNLMSYERTPCQCQVHYYKLRQKYHMPQEKFMKLVAHEVQTYNKVGPTKFKSLLLGVPEEEMICMILGQPYPNQGYDLLPLTDDPQISKECNYFSAISDDLDDSQPFQEQWVQEGAQSVDQLFLGCDIDEEVTFNDAISKQS